MRVFSLVVAILFAALPVLALGLNVLQQIALSKREFI